MMTAILLLAIIHPGRILVGPESEFPRKTRAEKKAEKRAKKEAKASKKAMKKTKSKGYIYDEVSDSQIELRHMQSEQNQAFSSRLSGEYDIGYNSQYAEGGHGAYEPPRYDQPR